jgi:hypothetical protein
MNQFAKRVVVALAVFLVVVQTVAIAQNLGEPDKQAGHLARDRVP